MKFDERNYIGKRPIQEIVNIVDAPGPPDIVIDPTNTWLIALYRTGLMSAHELAQREIRLAGLRINPKINGVSRRRPYFSFTLIRVADGCEKGDFDDLDSPMEIDYIRWSPDGTKFAFTLIEEDRLILSICNVETGRCHRIDDLRLNATLTTPYVWSPDSRSILCLIVGDNHREKPHERHDAVKTIQPVIQKTDGESAPARTYQDLLKSPYDEDLFEYYTYSRLVKVDVEALIHGPTNDHRNDAVTPLDVDGMIARVTPSPDGHYTLLERIERPFSYVVPHPRFPRRIDIVDANGLPVQTFARLPLAENIPIGFDAVRQGPRLITWRADVPATLIWAEAQDRGDPGVKAPIRDHVYSISVPFNTNPTLLKSLEFRYAGIYAGDDRVMIVNERWRKTRKARMWLIAPDHPSSEKKLLHDISSEDRYNDPGRPLTRPTESGTNVLMTMNNERSIFFVGMGASPDGDRPFLDRFDLDTKTATRLWRSEEPFLERPVRLIDPDNGTLLIRRESYSEAPNYFIHTLSDSKHARQITRFLNPTPELSEIRKEIIHYKRSDGVDLTATLYLPPKYSDQDGPLPMLMWAYPREFKSAAAAGQVVGSPHSFFRILPSSPLYLLTAGYAILDGPTMPIIGQGDAEPNDTYIEQLTMSAQAAVDEVVRRGVANPRRIAIGGHSYGAFMTANLLAHTDLFRAGIARSGAFNRTLTPFGFQSEERTFWEAPEVYMAMSPFVHADKINDPLLLIHGEADENAGTFPMQSERLFNALKGLGKTSRLCILPFESHGYRARESVLHMLWEMQDWLERHLEEA